MATYKPKRKTAASGTTEEVKFPISSIDGLQDALDDISPSQIVGYGTCPTAAATAAKVVTISDTTWTLKVGSIIGVKFSYTNSASSVTLNVNSTGAKSIWYNNAAYTSTSSSICGYANRVIYYMYDGTYWVWLNAGVLTSNTVPSAQCETAAATAAKTATCTNHTLTAKSFVHVNVRYTNTYKGAITLNIDSSGAKPIYLNGSATSSSNYNLTAGTYIAYYNGTNFYFRTDGKLTADITGNAATATKLGTSTKGSATQPIYLNGGTPTACTHTLGASIPACTTSNNGQFLTVINGVPTWTTVPNAEGVGF